MRREKFQGLDPRKKIFRDQGNEENLTEVTWEGTASQARGKQKQYCTVKPRDKIILRTVWSLVPNTTVKSNKLKNENRFIRFSNVEDIKFLTEAVDGVKRTGLSSRELVWRLNDIMNMKYMAHCQAHSTALYIFLSPIPFPPLERSGSKAVNRILRGM